MIFSISDGVIKLSFKKAWKASAYWGAAVLNEGSKQYVYYIIRDGGTFIEKYDLQGKSVMRRPIKRPCRLAVSPNNDEVACNDWQEKTVTVMTTDLKDVRSFVTVNHKGKEFGAIGPAYLPDGNLVFVEGGWSTDRGVYIYNPKTGKSVGYFKVYISSSTVATDKEGNIYLNERRAQDEVEFIQKYTMKVEGGKYVKKSRNLVAEGDCERFNSFVVTEKGLIIVGCFQGKLRGKDRVRQGLKVHDGKGKFLGMLRNGLMPSITGFSYTPGYMAAVASSSDWRDGRQLFMYTFGVKH